MRLVETENAFGGTVKYAIRADGRRQPVGVPFAEERAALSVRYGALDPDLADALRARGDSSRVQVAIFVVDSAVAPEVHEAFVDASDDVRAPALEQRRRDLRQATAPVEQAAREAGDENTRRADLMPVVFASLAPEAIEALARRSDVTSIVADAGERGREYAVCEGLASAKIDTAMNGAGLHGSHQRIGIVDTSGCAINDRHVALSHTTVHYNQAPLGCTQTSQCTPTYTGDGHDSTHAPLCETTSAGMKCVSYHSSTVASVIAASDGTTQRGAAQADLHVATNGVGGVLHCSASAMATAYDYLQTNGVDTVNESWGCDMTNSDGVTEDYYARKYGMMIVKAAGNVASQQVYGRRASNARCVGGESTGNSTGGTSYINFGGTSTDREDPDVVALSTGMQVTSYASTTGIVASTGGTSYAAPAMTALSALLKEACSKIGTHLDEKYLRSIVMNSAWFYDVDDVNEVVSGSIQKKHYSTPDPNTPGDYEDGAGGPTADNALLWCGNTSRTLQVGGGSYTIPLTGGNTPPTRMTGSSLSQQSTVVPDGAGSGLKYFDILTLPALTVGTRVRVTMNHDTCAVGTSGTGPSALGSDLDLWLCNDAVQKCFRSRSFLDNWEGFDTADTIGNIPNAGAWVIRVGYDTSNSPGCDASASEPVGIAAVWGPSASFAQSP